MSAPHPALAPLDAPTLVEASAGTGKTYTITTYYVRAIIESGHMPDQILVVTYTKAATADLRKRTRERIVEALERLDGPLDRPDLLDEILPPVIEQKGRETVERRLRNALAMLDQAAILTIHGFCQRLLQEEPLAFGIDFDFEAGEDSSGLYAELATDYWASELYDKPAWVVRALEEQGINPPSLAKLAERATAPRVDVLGPEPVDFDESLLERAVQARREVGNAWFAGHTEVRRILIEDGGLNRNSYKETSVRGWFPILDEFSRRATLDQIPDFFDKLAQGNMKMKKGFEEPKHPFFEACARFREALAAAQPIRDRAVFEFQQKFLDVAEKEVRRRRAETGVLTYDDLLTMVHDRVVGDPSVAKVVADQYPLALVDEFQDTDSLQYEIFRAVYGNGACVYVGDPKQAIYAFRGADVHSYIAAAKDVGERELTLDTNRRSDPAMVAAVNGLFGVREGTFRVDGIRFEPVHAHEEAARTTLSPALDFVWLNQDQIKSKNPSIADVVAGEVAALLRSDARIEGRPIAPGDIAVLSRSNVKAVSIAKALRALNVPTSLEGDSSVLSTEIATGVRAVLEAALLPGDARTVRRALLTPIVGVSPRELVDMDDAEWTTWVTRFQEWHELWKQYGVVRFLEDLLRVAETETRIAGTPTARRQLTDLLHVEELLMRGERERNRDPIALLQWYRRLEEGSPEDGMVRSEDLQQRPDAGSGAVRVTTIHKSKGLEYGVVFCDFIGNDAKFFGDETKALKFHDDSGVLHIDVGSSRFKENTDRAKDEKLEEALRVLYVALTRAKHRCTVFWGKGKGWSSSSLASLLHGPKPSSKLDEESLRAQVETLSAESNGAIGCREPIPLPVAPLEDETVEGSLEARPATRGYDHAPQIASFSSLTGHEEKVPTVRADEEDEPFRPPLFTSLPGGTRTGLLLHSILEQASFATVSDEEAFTLIEQQLRDYGFATSLAASVQSDLTAVVNAPLLAGEDAPTLSKLTQNLRELEFTLSLDKPDLKRLADILERHGAPTAAPSYPARLRQISGQSLKSFLRGFIDLVFKWDGRWYVADYKSNSLRSYASAAVTDAVQDSHYVLQALLYSAAARRYLQQRLPDFDVEADWGGAMFLFLRGMGSSAAPGSSVWFDSFSPELMDDLETWLGGGHESR